MAAGEVKKKEVFFCDTDWWCGELSYPGNRNRLLLVDWRRMFGQPARGFEGSRDMIPA